MNNWENPECFRENKESPHATLTPFACESDALNAARRFLNNPGKDTLFSTIFHMDLNGSWDFIWVNHPAKIPDKFFKPEFDKSDWGKIQVPSCVELEGYGIPIYSNVNYPFVTERIMRPVNEDTTDYRSAGHSDPYHMIGNPWIGEHGPLPVSLYHHVFTLPDDWKHREIIIHFDGVKSAFYLWINGIYTGYSQDSMTPAEFNITPFLRKGKNELAVQVHRWSDGSYLEDQDMWRVSGIYRDVYLLGKPKIRILDFKVETDLDEAYIDGMLDVVVKVGNGDVSLKNCAIVLKLYELENNGEFQNVLSVKSPDIELMNGSTHQIHFQEKIKRPHKWSAEDPNLYHMIISFLDVNSNLEIECHYQEVGFRKVEIRPINKGPSTGGAQFIVNGKPILFKGVNVHDWDPDWGLTVPFYRMLQDFRIFKQNNINAVRTSHYPKTALWYRLANIFGIYVMDEVNVESHGLTHTIPADDDIWRAACVDRTINTVERDKNQPSIVCWSLGNEAGIGSSDNPVHLSMKEALLEIDTTRPVQYENDYRYMLTDTIGNMYASPEYCAFIGKHPDKYPPKELQMGSWHAKYKEVEKRGDPVPWLYKPLILIEYATAGGNSGGGLQEYWDVFEQYPNLQGGFIWEYLEKCIRKDKFKINSNQKKEKIPNCCKKRETFLIGGDFGEKPYDVKGCCLGLVNPDRSLNPSVEEMKKVYQEIGIHPVPLEALNDPDPRKFKRRSRGSTGEGEKNGYLTYWIENKHFFKSLDHLIVSWDLLENGVPITTGSQLVPKILPRSIETLKFKVTETLASINSDAEYYLTIKFKLARANRWAPAGHIMAYDQFFIPVKWLLQHSGLPIARTIDDSDIENVKKLPPITLDSKLDDPNNKIVEVRGRDFLVRFNKDIGSLVYLEARGNVLFDGKMQVNLQRAFSHEVPLAHGNWLPENQFEAGLKDTKIKHISDHYIRFTAIFQFDDFDEAGDSCDDFLSEFTHEITVSASGEIIVRNQFQPRSQLVRLGITMPNSIPGAMNTMHWYGRGPVDEKSIGESYVNRKQSCPVGQYKSTVDDYLHTYFIPEECGNLMDTRWMMLLDSRDRGLLIDSIRPISMSVWPFTQNDLIDAKHVDELPVRENLTLNVDLMQIGMPPYEPFIPGAEQASRSTAILPGKYEYTFRIRPYFPDMGNIQTLIQKKFKFETEE